MKDNEISIFNLFKNKKKEDKNNQKKFFSNFENEKKKIKYIEKDNITKKDNNKEDTNEDYILNFSKFFTFFKKYYYILLIIIPIILTILIRSMPYNLPIAEDWARRSIEQNIKNNIIAQLSQQYPNLPQQNLLPLVEEQYKSIYSQQKQAIEEAVKQNANFIRQYFKDDKGITYLGDIDSYYWLRYARNIVEKGHIEDEKIDGRLIDNHMVAPIGFDVDVNMYPYIIAYIYKFFRIFNKNFTILKASFYTPMILAIFAVIIAFLLGKKLSGNLAGFIASVLIAINPTLLSRTLGSDNDMINILFPLLVMLFSVYAFDSKNLIKKGLFSSLAGLFIGIYSFAWSGWWFMFLFLISAVFIYLAYIVIYQILIFYHENKNLKKIHIITKNIIYNQSFKGIFIFLLVFLFFSFIGLSIFGNQNLFLRSFTNPFAIMRIKEAAKPSLWPNVYTTVAEMNEADFNQVVSSFGGVLFILIGFIGSLMFLFSFKNKHRVTDILFFLFLFFYYLFVINIANSISSYFLMFLISLPLFIGFLLSFIFKYELEPIHSILLIIWFIATIYASSKGVRFILLILPAFAISFSVFFSEFINKLSNVISKLLDLKPFIIKAIFFVFVVLLLITPIKQGYSLSYNYVPSVNDAWVEALTKINLESKENAIINSWWDFGHWFKYFADRAVTFDGASQNKPQAHWIGKVLLTNNENQSKAILRMLDCNSNNAFVYINEGLNDTHESVKLVYKLLDLDKDKAEKELNKIFSKEESEKILNSIYCEPPENYFITSEDMVGKAPVWGHFGLWNFQKADFYNYYKTNNYKDFISNIKKEYNLSEEDAKKIYYEIASLKDDKAVNDWIASWPGFMGSGNCLETKNENNNDKILQCNIGLQNQVLPITINLTNKEAFIKSNENIYPNAFAYANDNEFNVKRYDEKKLGYAIALLADNRTLLLMSEELVDSLFTRLFFYDGIGLKNFEKFHDVTDITGLRIITWKVKW